MTIASGWVHVLTAYTIAALALVLYEVKLWSELRDRRRSQEPVEEPQDS